MTDAPTPNVPPDAAVSKQVLDLSGLVASTAPPAVQPPTPSGPDLGSPAQVGPSRSLDATRETIAYILLGTLGGVIVLEAIASASFATACGMFSSQCTAAQSAMGIITGAMTTIFTAMVGLVGSVVGFYFGSQKTTP